MLLRNPVESAQMTLCLVPKVLDPVDVIAAFCKQFGVVDPNMMKVAHIKNIIAVIRVRINDAVRDDLVLHDPHQSS